MPKSPSLMFSSMVRNMFYSNDGELIFLLDSWQGCGKRTLVFKSRWRKPLWWTWWRAERIWQNLMGLICSLSMPPNTSKPHIPSPSSPSPNHLLRQQFPPPPLNKRVQIPTSSKLRNNAHRSFRLKRFTEFNNVLVSGEGCKDAGCFIGCVNMARVNRRDEWIADLLAMPLHVLHGRDLQSGLLWYIAFCWFGGRVLGGRICLHTIKNNSVV